MNELITKLAQSRRSLVELVEEKEELLASAIAKIPGYENLLTEITKTKESIESIEKQIRDSAVQDFRVRGNKRPHDAVQIKVFQIVSVVDEPKAREWCFQNFRPALKLDTKTFEKAAKDGSVPSDLVVCEEEPRAQIATDLSKYI